MAMKNLGPWSSADYENLSWHDVHVHGFRFDNFNPDNGSSDLVLDIDYILKWDKQGQDYIFTVCRAELRFHDAFGLKMNIDYLTPTAGMSPFSIDGIERELIELPTGSTSYRWRIPINWPSGQLEFEASRFTQSLVGKPHVQSRQMLSVEKRNE